MIETYEKLYNSGRSFIKQDRLWERYHNKEVPERLQYAIGFLYGNVLDVGSGDGYGAYIMLRNPLITHITGIEIQDTAIETSRKNIAGIEKITITKGIAEDINFEDDYFDCCHCGQTLEHIISDVKAVQEISRVTKHIAVFSVPINGGTNSQHLREYTEGSIVELLSEYFLIEKIKIFTDNKGIRRIVVKCIKNG